MRPDSFGVMSTDVTVGLIRALVDHLEDAPDDWSSFALVLGFDGEKVNQVHGYAYSPDGTATSAGADPYDIRSAVKAYTDSYYKPGEPLPVTLLVEFDRDAGKYEVTFEDTNAERWKLTPANFSSLREELRPHFD